LYSFQAHRQKKGTAPQPGTLLLSKIKKNLILTTKKLNIPYKNERVAVIAGLLDNI